MDDFLPPIIFQYIQLETNRILLYYCCIGLSFFKTRKKNNETYVKYYGHVDTNTYFYSYTLCVYYTKYTRKTGFMYNRSWHHTYTKTRDSHMR